MTQFFTPDEYVLYMVQKFPTLFRDTTLHGVKLRVFDQLFNVNGNGVSTNGILKEHLTYEEFDKEYALSLISNEDLYYGYTEIRWLSKEHNISMPAEGAKPIYVLDSDRVNHPEIKKWVKNTVYPWVPYPNFQKNYSTIYQTNFATKCRTEWLEAAEWFYNQCGWWFAQSENVGLYHYAFPKATQLETDRALHDIKNWLKKYETYEQIEHGYGVPFDGDYEKFMVLRWRKNLCSIHEFLGEVQQFLSEQINARTSEV
jgi:hypothetical protein